MPRGLDREEQCLADLPGTSGGPAAAVAGVVVNVENGGLEAGAAEGLGSVQHSFPFALIRTPLLLGGELLQVEEALGIRVALAILDLLVVGPEDDFEAGLGVGRGILRIGG
ncbi:hypothetical protein G6F65_016653 [Rhizopus arrhizus]|nr:hypothetical protein G6F65_016653 [Rhizopus arrhizus]